MKRNYDLDEILFILVMGATTLGSLSLSAFIIVYIYIMCTTGSLPM